MWFYYYTYSKMIFAEIWHLACGRWPNDFMLSFSACEERDESLIFRMNMRGICVYAPISAWGESEVWIRQSTWQWSNGYICYLAWGRCGLISCMWKMAQWMYIVILCMGRGWKIEYLEWIWWACVYVHQSLNGERVNSHWQGKHVSI